MTGTNQPKYLKWWKVSSQKVIHGIYYFSRFIIDDRWTKRDWICVFSLSFFWLYLPMYMCQIWTTVCLNNQTADKKLILMLRSQVHFFVGSSVTPRLYCLIVSYSVKRSWKQLDLHVACWHCILLTGLCRSVFILCQWGKLWKKKNIAMVIIRFTYDFFSRVKETVTKGSTTHRLVLLCFPFLFFNPDKSGCLRGFQRQLSLENVKSISMCRYM